jgi:ADP-heptose:LPS heptosyltransferase
LHRQDWRERAGARVLHDWAEPVGIAPAHAVDRMLALARHVAGANATVRFDLGLSQAELLRGKRAIETALGSAVRADDLLLTLSGSGDVRSWPFPQWVALARELSRAGRRVLAISGPREAEFGRRLALELAQEAGVRSWIGQRGLREFAAALSTAAQAGARCVGVDSGPLHLAAACGLRVIALEGPQSHLRTGPWPPPEREAANPRHSIVRSEEALACAPCFSRVCAHQEGPVCMSRLSAQRVQDAIAR